MLADLLGGLAMARRRWTKVLVVIVMVAVPSVGIVLMLGEVADEVQVAQSAASLQRHHAVAFTTFYGSAGVSKVPSSDAARAIASGRAYSWVLYNAGADTGSTSDGHRLVYIFGSAPRSLFPSLGLCHPAPCAMRGHGLTSDRLASVSFDGEDLVPRATLPRGATVVDPNAGAVSLGDAVVLVLPGSALNDLDQEATEEVTSRLVMLDPAAATVDDYVDRAAKGSLDLVPEKLDGFHTPQFRQTVFEAALYLVGFTAFLVLVLLTYAASVTRLVNQERRSMAIRYMHGGTIGGSRVRLAAFMACIAAGPVAALLALAVFSGESSLTHAALVILAVLVIFWTTLWVRASKATLDISKVLGGPS